AGELAVSLDGGAQPLAVVVVERLELDHLVVDERRETVVRIVDVRDAARHARGEVAAGGTEHHDTPAGHVLATVVADALHHRRGARVAHAEPLADDATEVGLATGRPVHRNVAGDDVVFGGEARLAVGEAYDPSAREALGRVVVGVALEAQRDTAREERAEALAGRAAQVHVDRAVGKPLAAPP